jgi:hypothetical protein
MGVEVLFGFFPLRAGVKSNFSSCLINRPGAFLVFDFDKKNQEKGRPSCPTACCGKNRTKKLNRWDRLFEMKKKVWQGR